MVVRHALTTAGCSRCRLAALKLFTSPANSLPIIRAGLFQCRPRPAKVAPIRTFSSEPVRHESSNSKEPAEEASKEEASSDVREQDQDIPEDSSSTNVPWYLQVEPPRHVATIEPPPLPEVPSGSPAIVGSLLEYASEELGLDELSLLDLREIDPPAALGPSLFMLFGTARSERHLNVSAGRLVRWLRAKHRVYAHADGLLGPNERKLKLRRKAKRAKLLGSTEDNGDDGIKTGWICVNLGTIGRGNEESAVISEDGRVAGFGVAQEGSTVVVQIMTEFRRAEMGLEALWKRALGQPADDPPSSEIENPENLHPLEKAMLSNSRPPVTSRTGHFNDTSRRTPFEQTRSYSIQQTVVQNTSEPDPLFDVDSKEALEQVLKFDVHQKRSLLELLQARLDTPSPFSDTLNQHEDANPFLRLSKLACEGLSPDQTWGFRLDLLVKLNEFGTMSPTGAFDDAQCLFEEMNLYGIEITRQQCLQLLTCIYNSNVGELKEQSELALQLLKTMQQRGQPVIANDIIVTIIEGAARSYDRLGSNEQLGLVRRLEDLLLKGDLPCMEEPLLMRLMEAYYKLRNWEGFWNVWRMPPRYLRPRSAALYVHVYELAAATRLPAVCTMTIRRCFQEMLAENPPVLPTGAVRTAVLDCIRVADPHAEQIAQSLPADDTGRSRRTKSEFVKLVRAINSVAR
ncbi:hypothetical protein F4821DRAFT_200752 [Hypoxylon rubiginosum]|uniref:Uncharacterized protein n=1 Tax=Hypoxylon rubiginosum TaxID=110542 RepID=A0ACC0DEV5_9PEZI|nr:hypothetical protein F4821DRAFT_200752 [Hypoxylon rubiginosum]